MGTVSTKESRRISFDNTFALSIPMGIQKSIETENAIAFDNIPIERPSNESLIFNKDKNTGYAEEGDGDYWSHRLNNLKKQHHEINKIREEEYDKTIETTSVHYESPKEVYEKMEKLKPCLDFRGKVLKCYGENPHQPLVCATIVQEFSNCVTNCRSEY